MHAGCALEQPASAHTRQHTVAMQQQAGTPSPSCVSICHAQLLVPSSRVRTHAEDLVSATTSQRAQHAVPR